MAKILDKNLQNVLEDIIHKVEIKSDFSIFHPEYNPLEIPEEVKESLWTTYQVNRQK